MRRHIKSTIVALQKIADYYSKQQRFMSEAIVHLKEIMHYPNPSGKQGVRALIYDDGPAVHHGELTTNKKHRGSRAGRLAISQAQKKRWHAYRKANGSA